MQLFQMIQMIGGRYERDRKYRFLKLFPHHRKHCKLLELETHVLFFSWLCHDLTSIELMTSDVLNLVYRIKQNIHKDIHNFRELMQFMSINNEFLAKFYRQLGINSVKGIMQKAFLHVQEYASDYFESLYDILFMVGFCSVNCMCGCMHTGCLMCWVSGRRLHRLKAFACVDRCSSKFQVRNFVLQELRIMIDLQDLGIFLQLGYQINFGKSRRF
eukprot:TRINITY_DN7033_c0_g2_i2.p1 TRINITY_DN7033_c0_g2~~TRINITY_DN7033_c0_g2_i2.p1  ORF type:complete len:215 (+),score=-11.22 TRINITY_DN7033_c0_g2_i2:168-812(+)